MNFTVVIPACGRPRQLARCLSLLPKSADVLVSDDSSDDSVQQMIALNFPDVRWYAGPRRGPAANRNYGAQMAGGEWLAFLDDDCEPQPGWLDALTATAADCDIVEGRTLAPGAGASPLVEFVENVNGGVLWSCNLAVRHDVFLRIGRFDEDFAEAGGEDMEFAWRVARAGLRVRFAPEAVVNHPPRRIGWRGLWRRTWMIRWMALYRAKTTPPLPLGRMILRECADLLRVTLHLFTRPGGGRWLRRFFAVVWRWVTFPAVLPWVLWWEKKFRRQLRERQSQNSTAEVTA